MSKVKFRFNTKSLTYEKIELNIWQKLLKGLSFLATGMVFAVIIITAAYTFFDSPKEKQLKREISYLSLQLELMNAKLDKASAVLTELQQRDDNIYRVIFEAEPIPSDVRNSGIGGVNRYAELDGFEQSDLVIATAKKLDNLTKQLVVQSKSFDEVVDLAKNKNIMLASIPAIQPVSNKDLTRIASGFNYRIHPIYKIMHFHSGMDFTAPTGTEIYSTGDGTIEKADNEGNGYGIHVVINHGYGYQTLYGHMSRVKVKPGQKVKRGEVIGYVGNTGTSSGPHVHYEVIKNGEKINPVNFFYSDLSPAEYEKVIELSSRANQSFD